MLSSSGPKPEKSWIVAGWRDAVTASGSAIQCAETTTIAGGRLSERPRAPSAAV